MNVEALDLNLLRTLDVLLRERSVTRAARVLGRSQPAVSHALGRLREAVGDPLLVREGRALVPTPRAEALADPVRRILVELQAILDQAPAFDPRTTTRTFRLACPDALAPLLPDLLAALGAAPGATVEILPPRAPAADVELGVLPADAPGVVARRVGTLHPVVVCRPDHPCLAGPWGLDAWLAWPHVVVRTGDQRPSDVDVALAAAGRQRRVGLLVGDLLVVPHILVRTDHLYTGPREILTAVAPLRCLPVPLPLADVPVAALWPERLAGDPGHRWFRERVIEAVRPLLVRADDAATLP